MIFKLIFQFVILICRNNKVRLSLTLYSFTCKWNQNFKNSTNIKFCDQNLFSFPKSTTEPTMNEFEMVLDSEREPQKLWCWMKSRSQKTKPLVCFYAKPMLLFSWIEKQIKMKWFRKPQLKWVLVFYTLFPSHYHCIRTKIGIIAFTVTRSPFSIFHLHCWMHEIDETEWIA